MTATAGAAFDLIASRYDGLWTNTPVGRFQREAVWRTIDPLFKPEDRVLDLGCGTGEDAVWLTGRGVDVTAIDVSTEMVRIACARGVNATLLSVRDLAALTGIYDGAISNFGALNCIQDVGSLRPELARLIRPGGHLALCFIGRFCAWETIYYLLHGHPAKAIRRWSGHAGAASLSVRVFYPSVRDVRRALAADFVFAGVRGIGVCVPPSYVTLFGKDLLVRLAALDRHIENWHIASSIADHRLLLFVRK
jgi:SAM-dependent methyltransferase